jgi:hypothetical protein
MIAMTPTIFDPAPKPTVFADQQRPADVTIDFSDLFSVATSPDQNEELGNSEELNLDTTSPAVPAFLIPISLSVEPIGEAADGPELIAGRMISTVQVVAGTAAAREVLTSDPGNMIEEAHREIGHSPLQEALSVDSKADTGGEFLPEAHDRNTAIVPEHAVEQRRFFDSEKAVSEVATGDGMAAFMSGAVDLNVSAEQTQSLKEQRISERKPFEEFWHLSGKEPTISHSPAKPGSDQGNGIAPSWSETLKVSKDSDAGNEVTDLTEAILDRFEARRSPEVSVIRPESRLPVELRAVDQVIEQLITFIPTQLAKGGKEILKMRLHPAELGHLEIEIERDGSGSISAHIRTDTESAQHILIDGLNELRDSLRDAGIDVGVLEVTTSAASSEEQDGRDDASRQSGVGEFAEGTFAHVDIDHETADEDRLVSLRA